MALVWNRSETKLNGQLLPTEPNAGLDIGGLEPEAFVTDATVDHGQRVRPGRVVLTLIYKPGVDLNSLRNLTGGTVTHRLLPSGPIWRLNDVVSSLEQLAGGRFQLTLEGGPAEQMATSS